MGQLNFTNGSSWGLQRMAKPHRRKDMGMHVLRSHWLIKWSHSLPLPHRGSMKATPRWQVTGQITTGQSTLDLPICTRI